MESSKNNLFKFIAIGYIVSSFYSCGLKYVPTETRESFFQKRQVVISNYILTQMNGQTLSYSSIAYGKTDVLKPISYKLLDSLYELKYKNEQNSLLDKKLEERISNQRLIALNDTAKVLYVENHVFSLGNKDTIAFYNALFQVTSNLKIDDIQIKQSVSLPTKYNNLYRSYLFEESYLNPGSSASENELSFYGKYKDELENRSIVEQDAFVLHTLKLMELAAQLRSSSNRELLNQITINSLSKLVSNPQKIHVLPIKENTSKLENGKTITNGFQVFLTYSILENEKISDKMIQFIFNQFLELKEIIKL